MTTLPMIRCTLNIAFNKLCIPRQETSRQITEAWNELQLNLTEEITVRTLRNKRQAETLAKAHTRQMMEDVTGWAHTNVYERLRDIWGDNTVIANGKYNYNTLLTS